MGVPDTERGGFTMKLRKGIVSAAVASIALVPVLVLAQCGMPGMSHGGHEGGHESSTAKRKAPPKEIRAWLADEERWGQLLEAVASDARFMRAMVERIAATPEWSALMRDRLAAGIASPDSASEEAPPAVIPEAEHRH
jgi:hypothetical protein